MPKAIHKKFYLVTNGTGVPATFKNTANVDDTVPTPANSMTHTGGKDGDYCIIPTCTSESNFTSNHMEVVGSGLNIVFWVNDDKDAMLYYSLDGKHSDEHSVPESKEWMDVSLLIDSKSSPIVKFFKF
jgi:hypothetical protein